MGMELKTSSDGISRALLSDEEPLCSNCREKISFGNMIWVCEKEGFLTCRKCTFKKDYKCPATRSPNLPNRSSVLAHQDLKAILTKNVPKKLEEE